MKYGCADASVTAVGPAEFSTPSFEVSCPTPRSLEADEPSPFLLTPIPAAFARSFHVVTVVMLNCAAGSYHNGRFQSSQWLLRVTYSPLNIMTVSRNRPITILISNLLNPTAFSTVLAVCRSLSDNSINMKVLARKSFLSQ
jgi:hypothetical protein